MAYAIVGDSNLLLFSGISKLLISQSNTVTKNNKTELSSTVYRNAAEVSTGVATKSWSGCRKLRNCEAQNGIDQDHR